MDQQNTSIKQGLTPCEGCGKLFASRNAVFKHLKDTDGACLAVHDRQEFLAYVRRTEKLQKVLILYGYLPFHSSVITTSSSSSSLSSNNDHDSLSVRDGQDAGQILFDTIQEWQQDLIGIPNDTGSDKVSTKSIERLNRSYGNSSKNGAECVRQDPNTAAISEVMAVRLSPLRGFSEETWLEQIQARLDTKYRPYLSTTTTTTTSTTTTPIRILGRLDMPHVNFNAGCDVSSYRIRLACGFRDMVHCR
jgi:hypothetical protein